MAHNLISPQQSVFPVPWDFIKVRSEEADFFAAELPCLRTPGSSHWIEVGYRLIVEVLTIKDLADRV